LAGRKIAMLLRISVTQHTMTLLRLVLLVYAACQHRWVDISSPNLTGDWLRGAEERAFDLAVIHLF